MPFLWVITHTEKAANVVTVFSESEGTRRFNERETLSRCDRVAEREERCSSG